MSPKRKRQPDYDPVLKDGILYWSNQPASEDGVLGGYGTGSLPRVETLGSRQFLLQLLPDLCTVPSALRPLDAPTPIRRTRALDVGAGIGRVTADTLLHLVDDVVLVEPTSDAQAVRPWKGIADKSKSVSFFRAPLQALDPAHPQTSAKPLGRVGYAPEPTDADNTRMDVEAESGFDVIWCQWCLMYMSDGDLVAFLKRAKKALRVRDGDGHGLKPAVIVVKENVASDLESGAPTVVWDEQDSSVTRSDLAWKDVFKRAGLRLVDEKVQDGLPEGLYVVKMYALR
ncbi:hypothetical protein EVG20_g328 [Dentipellis fragilis]|uniref:Alpha N-terminal protein methyltransferase 1 n=1 Tax=Dentipellis fragilis TaxID=205917 RepID=A0A4Y9ZFK4_9AGAM|nr:hypothetical protein EVG20_g328 [Dentipellis fragilis]